MNAINDLVHEHEAVQLTLTILQRIIDDIDANGKIANPEHLEQLFDFFSTFVDSCHHSKEEEFLFPALEEAGVSREGGPVGVMLNEHQRGRELVAAMKTAVTMSMKGDPGAALVLRRSANAYITLLRFHIEKENNVLFPLALTHLPATKLAQLKDGFDRIETEKIGMGRHEAYHKMIDALKDRYL